MKFKRGFNLAECAAYIFVLQMLIVILAGMTMKLYCTYNYVTDKNILNNSIDNTFFSIKKLVHDDNVIKTKYDNNKITVYLLSEGNYYIKEIKLKDSAVYIYYYESCDGENISRFLSANILSENIKEINFMKKGKIIYMKIKISNNEEYIECI